MECYDYFVPHFFIIVSSICESNDYVVINTFVDKFFEKKI
jgi:hypothetical protein